jgi:hypothetical protein
LAPTAILGYGFPIESFGAGLEEKPDIIAIDAGSTDPGPYYLGAGVPFTDKNAVKRDLKIIIQAAMEQNIPVIIGSAGGSGGEPHLNRDVSIVKEIALENDLCFVMAKIHAEVDKEDIIKEVKNNNIISLNRNAGLDIEEINETTRIVGQMGIEPFLQALDSGVQVIIAGRAYDPAVFAALAVRNGYDKGLAIHMGKILECASIAATPGSGSDCMMGYIGDDYFKVKPLNPIRKCTVKSVAAHTLYEKSDPYILPGPGGELNLINTKFEENDGVVKVTGSKYIDAEKYTIKLEGAKKIGYRTVAIAGVRDPIMIEKIKEIIKEVKQKVKDNFEDTFDEEYYLDFKIYGKNGVMGELERTSNLALELGLIIEVVAPTQDTANMICSFARSTMLHYGYEGRISTAGNLAFPYSPSDFEAGEVYVFSIYHLVEVSDPCKWFPIDIEIVGGRTGFED